MSDLKKKQQNINLTNFTEKHCIFSLCKQIIPTTLKLKNVLNYNVNDDNSANGE